MIHILMSACLAGENCKWDGGNNRREEVISFMERMKGKAVFHLVCPERDGGLPVPRPAAEVQKESGAVVNTEGKDVTAEFLLGAGIALKTAESFGCAAAVLKERSPSCGSTGIYDGTFSHKLTDGMGKTARLLKEAVLFIAGESQIGELEEWLQKEGLI